MQIIVTKCGEGKIKTEVSGRGRDLLEMLAAANAAVSLQMLKYGLPPAEVGDILGQAAGLGLDSAVDEWERDAQKEERE